MTLLTETNTPKVERLIRKIALAELGRFPMQTDFEHGQWWVTNRRTGAQWSVCDATSGTFAFEQVTEGDNA